MIDTTRETPRSTPHAAPTHGVWPSARPLSMPAVEQREPPCLSAIVVVGARRDRAQRVMDALAAQTRVDAIEAVVIDLAAHRAPRLETSAHLRTVYVAPPKGTPIGRARLEGARRANAPVVAFLLDLVSPWAGWAEALIEAHDGDWAAVGYATTIANWDGYVARSLGVSTFGPALHPMRAGESAYPGPMNVSYKRDVLLSFGDRLERLLTPDFNLHRALRERDLPMCVEPRAVVAYEAITGAQRFNMNFAYGQMLAARRAELAGWGTPRRIACALAAPLAVPAITMVRFAAGLRGRPDLWPVVLAALPVCLFIRMGSGVAEALGYLRGPGRSEMRFTELELE